MLAINGLGDGQINYASWPCANCVNALASDQDTCNHVCDDPAAMASVSPITSAQAVTGLPSDTSVSSIPGLPGLPTSTTSATNWWRIGLAAFIGLAVVGLIYTNAHRSA
jgi:hypothetical protein